MPRTEEPKTANADGSPRLDRRRFLSRSALSSGVLLAAPSALAAAVAGCGATPRGSTMASAETQELLDRLGNGLGRIRAVPRGRIARELTWVARPALSEHILRQTLEALVVADVARSLPADSVLAPPLADRLTAELPVMGRSAATHHAILTAMPGSMRRRLDRTIEAEPELPMEVAEWIDRHARELGTASESRVLLRLAARDVKARLRRQSTNAVIDDCLAKVDRVVARSGASLALARSAAAAAMSDAIWQQLGDPAGRGDAGDEDHVWSRFVDQSDRQWSAVFASPGDEEVRIGAIMMPFGLVSCGLMLIIGLIVLIAGLVQNADWDGTPRVRD